MENIAIVLVNYLNYKDTIECVESINNDIYHNKIIIIVDNGSKNESWEKLYNLYNNKKDIHLIKSNENLGFARGNNLGINYAREKLNCQFVLLANNDTIFEDPMLITKLMNSYEPNIAAIGPMIISANNKNQNPIKIEKDEKEEIKTNIKQLRSLKRKFKRSNIWIKIRKSKLVKLIKDKRLIEEKKIKENNNIKDIKLNKQQLCSEDLMLHGACMLLTKDYFDYYPYLYPKTFLYYEENILTLITKKIKLNKKYISDAYIYHKEDQSSKMSFDNLANIRERYVYASAKEYYKLFDLSYEEILKEFK